MYIFVYMYVCVRVSQKYEILKYLCPQGVGSFQFLC